MFPEWAHLPPMWVPGHEILQWGMRNGAEQDMHRQGVSERIELNVLFN